MKLSILLFVIGFLAVNAQVNNWNGTYYVLYPCNPQSCCCPAVNTKVDLVNTGTNVLLTARFQGNAVCDAISGNLANGNQLILPWTQATGTATDAATNFDYDYSLQTVNGNYVVSPSLSLTSGTIGVVTVDQSQRGGLQDCKFILYKSAPLILASFGALLSLIAVITF